MISQKNRERLDWLLALALAAMLINVAVPIQTTAARTVPPLAQAVTEKISTPGPVPSLPVIANKTMLRKLTVRSSAYSSTKDQTDSDPFTTASGTKVHPGTIAANGLPFGTKVRIPEYFGDTIFTVEDRMNAKWGKKKVDIWMTTRGQARQWGVRTITIEILS